MLYRNICKPEDSELRELCPGVLETDEHIFSLLVLEPVLPRIFWGSLSATACIRNPGLWDVNSNCLRRFIWIYFAGWSKTWTSGDVTTKDVALILIGVILFSFLSLVLLSPRRWVWDRCNLCLVCQASVVPIRLRSRAMKWSRWDPSLILF